MDKPDNFSYPDSLFYDTEYHLDSNGTNNRTNKLIDLLKMNKNALQKLDEMKSNVIQALPH